MGKEASRNEMKNVLLSDVQSILSERLDSDVLRVGPSEIAIPATDKDGNEFFYLVKISIPRGTRNGEGGYTEYDGYAAAEKEKERKREAKKVVKELNQKGLKGMIEGAE